MFYKILKYLNLFPVTELCTITIHKKSIPNATPCNFAISAPNFCIILLGENDGMNKKLFKNKIFVLAEYLMECVHI